MKLAAVFALALALLRRERAWLLLAGAALLWVGVEVGFALHGWSGNQRFLFAPAAVMVVLAGAAGGRVLALVPRRLHLLRWAAVLGVIALVVALVPHARVRARLAHNGIVLGRAWARQINRLHTVIHKDGSPERILACGQAVTNVSFQSILAWELGQNVGNIGWDPSRWIKQGKPIVLFEPQPGGWRVRPIHTAAANRASCQRLRINTASGATRLAAVRSRVNNPKLPRV